MKPLIIITFIAFISFILGYSLACILYISKKADEKIEEIHKTKRKELTKTATNEND